MCTHYVILHETEYPCISVCDEVLQQTPFRCSGRTVGSVGSTSLKCGWWCPWAWGLNPACISCQLSVPAAASWACSKRCRKVTITFLRQKCFPLHSGGWESQTSILAELCSFRRLQRKDFPCQCQLLKAPGQPWSMFITASSNLCLPLTLASSSYVLQTSASYGGSTHKVKQPQSTHPNFIRHAETLFPNKVRITWTKGWGVYRSFWGDIIQLTMDPSEEKKKKRCCSAQIGKMFKAGV